MDYLEMMRDVVQGSVGPRLMIPNFGDLKIWDRGVRGDGGLLMNSMEEPLERPRIGCCQCRKSNFASVSVPS